uniref:Pecanex-like protein n=1 Tax=Echinostoma caproni TaxID=27848 RepID=A0A183BC38_9TREM
LHQVFPPFSFQPRESRTVNTPCSSQLLSNSTQKDNEDRNVNSMEENCQDRGNEDDDDADVRDDDAASEPIGEVCSVTTTRPNWTAEDLIDPTDQWSEAFERLPPQPLSNSIAFHTFNLAKLVRKLAGGPRTSGSVFMAEPDANGIVHRNLHLVAFQVSLIRLLYTVNQWLSFVRFCVPLSPVGLQLYVD